MKNIFYSVALFHKAVKRNKPKEVYYYNGDFWFHTQKAVLVCRNLDLYQREAMRIFFKCQDIEVQNETER